MSGIESPWAGTQCGDGVDGLIADPEAFIAALERVIGEHLPPELRPLVLANDLRALAAAAQERTSLEDVLPRMTMLCLLFVGEADARYHAVQACATHMARASFVGLPGLNHVGAFVRSDLVLPHMTNFLVSVPW